MNVHKPFFTMPRPLLNPQTLVLTSPHNLGDFVAKIPLIRLLKQHFPKMHLILMARRYIQELAALVKEVDQFVDFEAFFMREDEEIISDLKSFNADVIIHLLSQQKQMGPDVLAFAEKAAIKHRLGNVYRSSLSLWLKKKQGAITHNLREKRILPGVHEFQWNLLPLRFFGLNSSYSLDQINTLLKVPKQNLGKSRFIDSGKFNLIVHPGSHGNAKEWPQERFLELINSSDATRYNVIITGSKQEALRFNRFKTIADHVQFIMGDLSLTGLLELIAEADGLIGASTGPVHLASLFDTPTIALFPPQEHMGPKIWGPLGRNVSVIQATHECLSCQKKLTDFNGNLCTCMDNISLESVLNVVKGWDRHESII